MVANRQALGMTTEEVVSEEDSDNGSTEKRGRGRPLTAKVEALQNQIHAQSSVQVSVPASSNQLEKRVTVIQAWVENFHQFLLTSRITNSVDRVAEEELALIIRNLPDNPPINAEG